MSEALQSYADFIIRSLPDADVDDFRNKFQALLDDLYTVESIDNMPVGAIVAITTLTVPDKWLLCDGQDVPRPDYPELWDATPSDWHLTGVGGNPDIIVLPDMTAQFIYGTTTGSEIGDVGGEATHTLTIAEMPAHSHTAPIGTNTGASLSRAGTSNNVGLNTIPTSSQGGGGAHNNLPPYIKLCWIIKALP